MSKSSLAYSKSRAGKRKENKSEKSDQFGRLDIWDDNPSFKDKNTLYFKLRGFSVLIIAVFFTIAITVLSSNLMAGFIMGVITIIFFIVSFYDTIYGLRGSVSLLFHKYKRVNIFNDFTFFFTEHDENILYISNKEDLKTVALSIFKVEVLPETTQANLNQFLKSLNAIAVPYTFQIHQQPLMYETKANGFKGYLKQEREGTMKSFTTAIYFAVYYDIAGILTSHKILELQEMIKRIVDSTKTAFTANFHHYKVQLLSGNQLIFALRSFVIKNIPYEVPKHKELIKPKINAVSYFLKVSFCLFVLILTSFLLIELHISLLFVLLCALILVAIMLWVWWRAPLYYLTVQFLLKREDIKIIKPFQDINLFKFRGISDALYFLIGDKLLVCAKMFNLKHASIKYFYDDYGVKIVDFYPGKFFHAVMQKQIPFIYTVISSPLSYYKFDNTAFSKLNLSTQAIIKQKITSDKEGEQWLEIRSGIWQTLFTASTYAYKSFESADSIGQKDFYELANLSRQYADSLEYALAEIFHGFHEFVPLTGRRLIFGSLCEIFKNKLYTFSGTRLDYLLFQGKLLMFLTKIEDEFKKGIDTRLAAEFNTPLTLENFISFGHTINTEFWEKEIPAGLTRGQLESLLIVNGVAQDRENLAMKLVAELVKSGVPSLIFDYSGNWSKLINYFCDTRHKYEILHFKMGKAFGVDPLRSDINYDKNNMGYLDYMFDSYAIAFKKDKYAVDMFRNHVKENEDLDLTSLALELKNQPAWKKSRHTASLISIFDEFTEHDETYLHHTDQEQAITFKDFIANNKTVIVDLSFSRDLKKKNFIAFVILSKIIHYISNFDTFCEKVIFMPHIDLFFDEKYLDKTMELDKIDKFIEPLKQEGFGTIFSANQVHYLHPRLVNYFENIITFKTTDYRDVSMLKNLMGLEELHDIGYYSKNRKSTYQIRYLQAMKNNEVLINRNDKNQTFPVEIDLEDIEEVVPLEFGEIAKFMGEQGYNLQLTERRILERMKKTIFEKDFGSHFRFVDEIIKFRNGLKMVHKVPLYETKIKEELLKIIYPKGIKIVKGKRELKKLRDELFNIMITHRYLVEDHPKTPGGQEGIRTSYRVGEHFEKAIQDYEEAKNKRLNDVSVDVIEQNSSNVVNIEDIIAEREPVVIPQDDAFKEILAKELSDLHLDLFHSYKYIGRNDFGAALDIEKNFVKKFIMKLYKIHHPEVHAISNEDLEDFCSYLSKYQRLPFSKEHLVTYLHKYETITEHDQNIESKVKEIYDDLSLFFDKIQDHVNLE